MKKLSADETLITLIDLFLDYLEFFNDVFDLDIAQFVAGERIAYVECLEVIQNWEYAEKNGLDFDIESRFPV